MEVVYHNLGMQIWLVIKKLLVVVRAPIPIPIYVAPENGQKI